MENWLTLGIITLGIITLGIIRFLIIKAIKNYNSSGYSGGEGMGGFLSACCGRSR